MTDRRDAWTVLAERGEWRGADEVASRALSQLHPHRDSGVFNPAEPNVNEPHRPLSPPTHLRPKKRRVPGWLIGAAVFVLVMVTAGIPLLIGRFGEGQAPASDATMVTDSVPTDTFPTDTEAADDPDSDEVVTTGLVSMEQWPSPSLDPVLNSMTCPSQPDEPGWFLPERLFDTLGLDRSSLNLVDADRVQIAASTPMLRVGTMSILSLEDLDGACLLTVADGDTTGWALYLSSGEPAMTALSTPHEGNSVPDEVIEAPGEYQQWLIATGQQFNGGVAPDGRVHALTNRRLLVAEFAPDLVPDDRFIGGWLLASLAISPSDTAEMIDAFGIETITPTVLPPGYGLCAADPVFFFGDSGKELTDETWQLLACNSEGSEILITVGSAREAPDDALTIDVNGIQVRQWSTEEHNIILATLPGQDLSEAMLFQPDMDIYVQLQAPKVIDHDTLTAILTAIPLTETG